MANGKTLEKLQEEQTEMLATAHDLGLEVPDELKAEFTDVKAGKAMCASLNKMIQEFTATKEPVDTEEALDVSNDEPKKETKKVKKATVAKKTTAKKAKKAVAKKGRRVAAKKAATNGAGRKRAALDENAKITWVGEGVPGREGSARWKRIENLKKHGGKTVGTFLKSSIGKPGTLRWCVNNGLVKI